MARHIENLRIIFQKGVNSVQPAFLFNENKIINRINAHLITINNHEIDLTNKNCHLVGFGKAVLGMAVQMEHVLDKNLKSGIISVPYGISNKFENNHDMKLKTDSKIVVYEGAENNLPDELSLKAAKDILSLANKMTNDDVLFVLISGGGSALLPLPREPFDINSKLNIVKKLANAGANIEELNTVRILMSKSKGGQLSIAAKNASEIVSLIISDIINNPLELIASGPTIEYNYKENKLKAKLILEKFNIWNSLPDDYKLIFQLDSSRFSDNFPKNNHVFVIGNNEKAVKACKNEGINLLYAPFILSTTIDGNIEEVCKKYIAFIKNVILYQQNLMSKSEFEIYYPFDKKYLDDFFQLLESITVNKKPLLLILAGEPLVHVTGNGLGGRNQELAIRMSLELNTNKMFENVYVLFAGTDGIDGPTPSAGAIGCTNVIKDFISSNSENSFQKIENVYIKNNDSYNFYKNLQNAKYHINIGHTGINVMDLHLIIVDF